MYRYIAKSSPAVSGSLQQYPFAALICSGSRWPSGSLVMPSVVMPKHEAVTQIA